jgi:hypothetical protein
MEVTAMSSVPQVYYVYVLARPDGRVFYVGKGKGRRIWDHDKEARKGHQCHKCNIIRKIWRQGGEVQRYTVLVTASEQEALDYECELIAQYGRKNLSNLTDGGEGQRNPSAETREKISRALRGRTPPNKGIPLSEEAKRHLSEINKGKKISDENLQKLIAANTGRAYNEERQNKSALTQTNGRTYVAVAPDGTVYTGIENIRAFERAYNLPDQALYMVVRGKAGHGAGWVAWIEGDQPRPQPKMYTLIAPDGTRYSHIWNVSVFAKAHGLNGSYIRAMLRGAWPHAHGWTGFQETP